LEEWEQRLLNVGRRMLHHEPRRVSSVITNPIPPRPSGGGDDGTNPLDEWLVCGSHRLRRRIGLRRAASHTLNEDLDACPVLLILFRDLKKLCPQRRIESRYSTSRVTKSWSPLRLPPK
jgi:hypothetical protein